MTQNITYSDKDMYQVCKFRDENNLLDSLTKKMHKDRSYDGIYKPLGFFEVIPRSIWNKYGTLPFDPSLAGEVLVATGDFIELSRKTPIGSLFKADYSYGGTYIPVQLLWEIEQHRFLDPVQMHELERLLNLAGQSLSVNLPPIPALTDDDFREIMLSVAYEVMLSKPRIAREAYLKQLNVRGVPMKVTEAEFKEAAKKHLLP